MTNKVATQTDKESHFKVAVYGGNGFVGTRVCEQLANKGVCTISLSRSGHKPLHLKDAKWSESVRWSKGDASKPDLQLLEQVDVLILLVGSPPLPTFSKESYEHQVFMNGTTNVNAIEAAVDAGVKHLILLGAKIPWPINHDKFGYAKGKRLAAQAAQKFSELSEHHSASVIKPSAIYGKRHLANGKVIPLDWFMSPLEKIMPWQFISVEAVASRIAEIAVNSCEGATFKVIEHSDI